MMDWTDRHCRYFLRLISPHTRLFTEMVTTGAILHGDHDRFLRFSESEKPLVLQLGGSDPAALAISAKHGEAYGYDEINLNCGCPSDRVQNGSFGACLMAEPQLVARCVSAMRDAVSIPVTVKCRIGIDECDEIPFLNKFIEEVSKAGCEEFTVHARKAWLKGLSPKENREIPPLRYDVVSEMRQRFPHLRFILNGGLTSVEQVKTALTQFDGVMIGREAYHNPWFLASLEREVFGHVSIIPRETIARMMIPYIEEQGRIYGTPVKTITRHMLGLYQNERGARGWRRHLSENAHLEGATGNVIEEALQFILREDAQRPAA
jgi:tRNA-dihydrouridine synthase A